MVQTHIFHIETNARLHDIITCKCEFQLTDVHESRGLLQVAEVVAQVLLQAQTDVLVEVAADPDTPPQAVDTAVAQVTLFCLSPAFSTHVSCPPCCNAQLCMAISTALHVQGRPCKACR